MTATEQVDIDVATFVDADLARGDHHHGILETRQMRGAVHASHHYQAAADILDRQSSERHVGRWGRHIHDAMVKVRQASIGRGLRRTVRQTDAQSRVAVQRDALGLRKARAVDLRRRVPADLVVVVFCGLLLVL